MEVGDWSDAATSQGKPRTASQHQKPGEKHGPDSSSEHGEGTNPADTLISDFRLLASSVVRGSISDVFGHFVWGHLLHQPYETNTGRTLV